MRCSTADMSIAKTGMVCGALGWLMIGGCAAAPADDGSESTSAALVTPDDEGGPSVHALGGHAGLAAVGEVGAVDITALAASSPRTFMAPTTPVRDQGDCNVCWAYAMVAAMETNMLFRRRTATSSAAFDLSERSVTECVDAKCRGGVASTAAVWASHFGVNAEGDASCGKKRFHVTSAHNLPSDANGFASVASIKDALRKHGAVMSYVWASNRFEHFGGPLIFDNGWGRSRPVDATNSMRNHEITIVGWNDDFHAWRIKNSWGSGWGDGGYAWVDYESANIGRWSSWLEADYGDGSGGISPDPLVGGFGPRTGGPPPPPPPPPAGPTWHVLPGLASDVASGGGQLWVTGVQPINGGYNIFYWTGAGWNYTDGAATRIAVDPSGSPWVVNTYGNIFRRVNGAWQVMPGLASDIAIGANGQVWVLGVQPITGGYNIFYWTGTGWNYTDGAAARIAVDPSGNPWVVNTSGNIFRRVNGAWQVMPGLANDIGVGANGAVWITGKSPTPGGYNVFYWTGSGWNYTDGGGLAISVDGAGHPVLVNDTGNIFIRE